LPKPTGGFVSGRPIGMPTFLDYSERMTISILDQKICRITPTFSPI
jgi:hypothetical protein